MSNKQYRIPKEFQKNICPILEQKLKADPFANVSVEISSHTKRVPVFVREEELPRAVFMIACS